MLNRQRTLLAILEEAGGQAPHRQVTNWAFLCRHETESRGGSAFYHFVPYRYGPFSFCLFQEAAALLRDGLLEEVDDETWRVCRAGSKAASSVPEKLRQELRAVVHRKGRTTAGQLSRYVYEKYHWYTVNSELDPRQDRPRAKPAIYTVGYEGLSVDGFLNGLLANGIAQILDVRNNPVSRRYGFHRSTLARLAGRLEIDYLNIPELGITSVDREGLSSEADYAALFDRYEADVIPRETESVRRVGTMTRERASALVCMERSSRSCHRSRLAAAMAEETGLAVIHLDIPK